MESLAIEWFLASQTVTRQYYEVFMSGNGQYAFGTPVFYTTPGPIIRSFNFGQNYSDTTLDPYKFWVSIGVSDSGQYVAAGAYPGPVVVSNDFGITWKETDLPTTVNWDSSVLSDSGQYIVMTGSDYGTAVSTDYGVNWNVSCAVGGKVAISYDGQHIMGRGSILGPDLFVYYSPDHGNTWLNTTQQIAGRQCGNMWYGWNFEPAGVVIGRTLYVAPLNVSANGHINWKARSFAEDNDNEYIYCDYTGQYVFFSTHTTGVSYSADYGYTWHRSESNYDYDVFMMSIDRNATRIVTASFRSSEMYYGSITKELNPNMPTRRPTSLPSSTPSAQPSRQPSNTPSSVPTSQPTCGSGSSGQANNTFCTPCEPGTYSPPFQTHCTACPVGTYSPHYGASECTPCEYPLTTLSDGQSECTAVNVNMGVLPTSFILAAGVFVVCVCIATGREIWIQIALNFMYPTLDVFSDIAYLLTNDFYSVQIFVACILFIVFPVPWFVARLVQLKAVPSLWFPSNRVLWCGTDRIATTHLGMFELSLPALASGVTTILLRVLYVLVWLILLPLNCLFLFAWLLLGMFFYLTKCIAIGPVWNMWFCVWTGGSDHSTDVTIDTEELNICLQHEFYFETLPQFCLQLINNMYLGKLSSVAIFSFVWSLYTALNGLWKFVYYRYCLDERKEMRDIPIDKSLRIRLKWLNIDWVLVDAKLTPQSKDKPGRAGGLITRSTKLNSRAVMCGDDGFFDTTVEESELVQLERRGLSDNSQPQSNNNRSRNERRTRSRSRSRSSRREYTVLSNESFYSQDDQSPYLDCHNPVVFAEASLVLNEVTHTVEPEPALEHWLQFNLREQGVSESQIAQCCDAFKRECITSVAVWTALPETVFDRDYLSAVGITQVELQQHLLKLHSVIRGIVSNC